MSLVENARKKGIKNIVINNKRPLFCVDLALFLKRLSPISNAKALIHSAINRSGDSDRCF